MNVYFSGVGGVGIGPLAEIANDAGYKVMGSDIEASPLTEQLSENGVKIHIGQDGSFLNKCHDQAGIDWFVYTSALSSDHPELVLAKKLGIKTAKRDEFLSALIQQRGLKLIAVAGTHGKTTTTSMLIWTFKQMGVAVSYSVGTTLSFGNSGVFNPDSEYFVYEADEYDKNFLHFTPFVSVITSVDYDHPDTYPTEQSYHQAFKDFLDKSNFSIGWRKDFNYLDYDVNEKSWQLQENEVLKLNIPGEHNRRNATLVYKTLEKIGFNKTDKLQRALESFPGSARRFEKLADNLYSDYGHHPEEIAATLQMASEISNNVVLVYQPHQNLRQHSLLGKYTDQFELASQIYWLPTYLSREDKSQATLSPQEISFSLTNKSNLHFARLDDDLWNNIQRLRKAGKLVLCMGAGTIDAWVRNQLKTLQKNSRP